MLASNTPRRPKDEMGLGLGLKSFKKVKKAWVKVLGFRWGFRVSLGMGFGF